MDDPVTHEDGDQVARQDEAFARMTGFLQEYMDDHDGHMYLHEFGTFIYVMMWRMRQTMTFDQLGRYIVGLINTTEGSLMNAKEQHGDALILAEDWQGIEGGREMLLALQEVTKDGDLTVPEDWSLEDPSEEE